MSAAPLFLPNLYSARLTRCEADTSFTPPLRQEAEAHFASRKDKDDFVEYEFEDYEGAWSCSGPER